MKPADFVCSDLAHRQINKYDTIRYCVLNV